MGGQQSVSTPGTPRKKKTITSSLRRSLSSSQIYEMQPYQKSLLRQAWQKINKNQGQGGNVGNMILKRMMTKNPSIKKVFQQYVVIAGVFNFGMAAGVQAHHNHSLLFIQLIDMAVSNIDDLELVGNQYKCQEYGRQHAQYAQYGMSSEQWDTFGEAITESSREWEGWKTHRETLKAWTLLVSFIVDRLRQGFDQALRKNTVAAASGGAVPAACRGSGTDMQPSCSSANTTPSHTQQRRRSSVVVFADELTTRSPLRIRRKNSSDSVNSPSLTRRFTATCMLTETITSRRGAEGDSPPPYAQGGGGTPLSRRRHRHSVSQLSGGDSPQRRQSQANKDTSEQANVIREHQVWHDHRV